MTAFALSPGRLADPLVSAIMPPDVQKIQ